MRGEGKRDPRPADSPGRLRQSKAGEIGKLNLIPCSKGEVRNPTGNNGMVWLKQFRDYFNSPSRDDHGKTRYQTILDAAYVNALRGREATLRVIVEQMNGKQTSLLDYAEHFRQIEADRIKMAIALLGDQVKTMTPDEIGNHLAMCRTNADAFIQMAKRLQDGEDIAPPPQIEQAEEPAQLEGDESEVDK